MEPDMIIIGAYHMGRALACKTMCSWLGNAMVEFCCKVCIGFFLISLKLLQLWSFSDLALIAFGLQNCSKELEH
jgi:hypothetical protein